MKKTVARYTDSGANHLKNVMPFRSTARDYFPGRTHACGCTGLYNKTTPPVLLSRRNVIESTRDFR